MVIDSVATFVQIVTKSRLLEPVQQEELLRELSDRFSDPKELARALLARDWLTSMQINYLFQGKAAELVVESYILRERLGESRVGQVYKARHLHMRRIAALKLVREELLADPRVVERFYQEIQTISSLAHPHIVHAYDAGPVGRSHFFAVEFVNGTDLERLIKQTGTLTLRQACDYIAQAALGLQYAYERGLLHLDVRPANLLVTRAALDTPVPSNTPTPSGPSSSKDLHDGHVKIRNLGITPPLDSLSPLFHQGRFLGDPDYRAPELNDPGRQPDIRSEMYSLGCTLYFLLTGQLPFPEGTVEEKLRRHQFDEPTPIEIMRTGVPPGLSAIVRRLLAKQPDERFATPSEVVTALAQLSQSGLDEPTEPSKSPRKGLATLGHFLAAMGVKAKERAGILVRARSSSPAKKARWADRLSSLWFKLKLAGTMVILLLATFGVLSLFKINSSQDKKDTLSTSDDPIQNQWNALRAKADDAKVDANQYRDEVFTFRWKFPGTPQAAQAEELLARLSSPLDAMLERNIPKSERVAGQPKELVSVIGTHRSRHWAEVFTAVFSRDGKYVASGGSDTILRIWNASTMEEHVALRGHTGRISCVAFAPDNQTLASCADDESVRVWTIAQGGRHLEDLKGHAGHIYAVAFAPRGKKLACGGTDKLIRLWDLDQKPPKVVATMTGHGEPVSCLAFSPDGSTLVSGSNDRIVRVWDAANGAPKAPGELRGHTEPIMAVAFAPDGKAVVSCSMDRTLRLWKVDGTQPVDRPPLQGHGHGVRSVAWAADGKTVASAGGEDRTVRVWDVSVADPKPVATLLAHTGRADTVAFSADGKVLVTGGEDDMVRLFNVAGATVVERIGLPGHIGPVHALALSSDLKTLASSGADHTIHLWDLTKPESKETKVFHSPFGAVNSLKFVRDDKALLTNCGDGHVRVWNVVAKPPKHEAAFPGSITTSSYAHLTLDGKTLVTASGNRIDLQAIAAGKKTDWVALPVSVTSLLLSPDGRHVFVGLHNGLIYVLRLPPPPKAK